MRTTPLPVLLLLFILSLAPAREPPPPRATPAVRVGAAAVELEADDNMVIGGSIMPGRTKGQDGKLRAVATVIEKPGAGKVAIVACNVLMLNRDLLDSAIEEVATASEFPAPASS